MPRLFGEAVTRAVDANGDPVSGAKLTVYLAGTTTAVTTYSDEALTTAQAVPVVADSSGVFAPIYVEAGSYKVDITDPDTGASLPGYPVDYVETSAGVSSGEVRPEAYDAAGDGVTDDTTAMQAWIDAIEANGYIGVGRPGATYKVTSTLTVDASDVTLRGNGAKILFDNPTLNGDDVIDVAGTRGSPLANFEFSGWIVECTNQIDRTIYAKSTRGVRIYGNNVEQGRLFTTHLPSDSTAITSPTSGRPTVANVTAADRCREVFVYGNRCTSDDSAWSGAVHKGPSGDRVDFRVEVPISGATGTFTVGELVTGGTSGETAYVVFDLGTSVILRDPDSNSISFTSGETLTGGTSGVSATAGSQTQGANDPLSGEGLNTGTISLRWVDGGTVFGNFVEKCRNGILWIGGDANFAADGAVGSTRGVLNISITGNRVQDCRLGGIWGAQGKDIAVTGNTVKRGLDIGIHGEGSDGIVVSGNTISDFKNGCINPYFIEERAVYTSNTMEITDATTYGNVIIKNNLGSDAPDFEVLISNNHVRMKDAASWGEVQLQRGGVIRLSDNIFWRCYVDGDVSNAGERRIVDNEFYYPDDPGVPAVKLGRSLFAGDQRPMVHVIEGNRFICWDWTGTGFQPCIYSKQAQASGTRTSSAIIRNNRIQGATFNATDGFPQDIVTESTNNIGFHATEIIGNGLWKGIVFDMSDKSGVAVASLNQSIMYADNYSSNPNNVTVFSAPPTRGVYLFGSRISIDRPTVGGPSEYVVTGSQKVWAPTSGTYSSGTDYEIGDQIDYDPGGGSRVYVAIAENGPSSSVVTPGADADTWRDVAPLSTASAFYGYGYTRLSGSKTYQPGGGAGIADGAEDSTTVTINGADTGDFIRGVQFSADLDGARISGWQITASNTATVWFKNDSGSSASPPTRPARWTRPRPRRATAFRARTRRR